MSSQVVEDRELVFSSGFYADLGTGVFGMPYSLNLLIPWRKRKEGLVVSGTAICISDSNTGVNSDFVNIELRKR